MLILSLSIFVTASIVSDASGVAGTSSTVTITYNNSEDMLCAGNTYLPWNWQAQTDGAEIDLDEMAYFWYKGKQVKLFDSSADFYGYYVTITRSSNTTNTSEHADQKFWCVGTAGQLMQGENRGGTITSSSFSVWVPTNYSVQPVHMSPFYHFFFEYDRDVDNDYYIPNEFYGSYSINAKYTVKYTGYKTKSEYTSAMNDIKMELEEQTGIQNDQLTELEEQTGIQNDQLTELEEQTENQKNFFGSFFQNLVDSVLGLFVPDKEGMADLFAQLDDFFNEKFGFLYYPFDVFFEFVNMITSNTAEAVITLPGFSIMGHVVWEDITYNFGRVTLLQTIAEYTRMGSGALIVFGFIDYLRRFFDKRFGGGGS